MEDTPLLTEKQVATMLHVSVGVIRKRRTDKQPPMFLRIGKSIRYRRETVIEFMKMAEERG